MNTAADPIETETSTVESGVLATLSRAEIDQQVSTARAYPRNITKFRTECLQLVTLTEKVAEECIYALPRDGRTIEGPSARFAEILASSWGNCRAGARVVSEENDFVVAQGVFHDMERNVHISYEVKRRIVDKHGNRYKPDMIGVTANAACSIALRNAILKGVPKALWTDMYDAARKVIMGDSKTLASRRAEALSYLQKFGVTEGDICRTLSVAGVEDIGLDHIVTLRGLATAIRDGDTTAEQAFGLDTKPTKTGGKAAAQAAESTDTLSPEDREKRAVVVQKLTDAAGKSLGDLTDAWAWLSEAERKLVGTHELERLKKLVPAQ